MRTHKMSKIVFYGNSVNDITEKYIAIATILKGNLILFRFLFLMEKSVLYAKITVSQIFFFKIQF